ncbi:MAG: DUF58 domain-containing protein [Deltaproteobacteria bacterium]|jgi:uncharacterized protein (DUF58 family)|nr:DUF58 domain-containing protein [Deltaproteobacteria bacterium]
MQTLESRLSSVFIIPLVQFLIGVCLFIALLYGQRDLTMLGLLVLGITFGARLWSRLSFAAIRYAATVDKHKLFPGESLTLHVSAENAKFLPVWLQMRLHVEGALDPSSGKIGATGDCWLLWFQKAHFNWGLVARHRGVYRLGQAHMKVGDIFGFFPREKRATGDIQVIVYPKLVPLKPFSPPIRDFYGVPGGKSPVQDPIYILGTRDYQHGRPARHIHWKASARHNRLQEKVFEPSEQGKVLLAVEVSQFGNANASESFEHTLEVVGSLAIHYHQRGFALGFVTNGVVKGGPLFLSMGRSPQKLSSVLEILARLKMRTNGSLTDIMHRALELPWGVSCVHFAYEQDQGTRATAQYFSYRRIPMIFVVCSCESQWEGDGHKPGAKTYCLDEIRMEEIKEP